jgi:sortase (surface protein transpeptidase)
MGSHLIGGADENALEGGIIAMYALPMIGFGLASHRVL